MKLGTSKSERIAVVTCDEKYRAYLGKGRFKLRVDNKAPEWLKMYSNEQSYICRWIVKLNFYHLIIEYGACNIHLDAGSFSKKRVFSGRLE